MFDQGDFSVCVCYTFLKAWLFPMYVSHCIVIVQIVRRDYKRGAESLVSVGSRTNNDEIEVERCEAPLCSYNLQGWAGRELPFVPRPLHETVNQWSSIYDTRRSISHSRARGCARERERARIAPLYKAPAALRSGLSLPSRSSDIAPPMPPSLHPPTNSPPTKMAGTEVRPVRSASSARSGYPPSISLSSMAVYWAP